MTMKNLSKVVHHVSRASKIIIVVFPFRNAWIWLELEAISRFCHCHHPHLETKPDWFATDKMFTPMASKIGHHRFIYGKMCPANVSKFLILSIRRRNFWNLSFWERAVVGTICDFGKISWKRLRLIEFTIKGLIFSSFDDQKFLLRVWCMISKTSITPITESSSSIEWLKRA